MVGDLKRASDKPYDGSPVTKARRTEIKKDIKAPDAIPEAGIQEAIRIMTAGKLYRYNVKTAAESVVSQCEVAVAAYTGHKYCVALNSCGSALYLMLLAAGVKPGDKVLTNAFTFVAVPSAIQHAGAKAVYVESTKNYTMDVQDLEAKIASSGAKYVMISHMRGKIADMDDVKRVCDAGGVTLLEDCAHSIGVRFGDGSAHCPHTGHHGVACAISSQSYKMLNSGEGGFYLTNDGLMAAKVAVYAGAYEGLSEKHLALPGKEIIGDLPCQLPNYSLRMSQLSAAVLIPQVPTIEERCEKYNVRYSMIADRLNKHPNVDVPKQNPKVRICGDSIQFNLQNISDEQVAKFISECKARGLYVELFGAVSNARNFVNWKFASAEESLPQTAAMLKRAIDIRLPLTWEDSDFEMLCQVVEESLASVL